MFGSKPKKSSVVALFDLSSSSVAAAHAIVPATGKPSIIASVRIDAPLKEDSDTQHYLTDTATHLDTVIDKLRKADHHQPDYIQVVLASPWYVSQTRSVTFTKDTPFTCTEKLIDKLIAQEVEYIIEHDMEQFGTRHAEGVILEKQISLIKLNGYPTSKPIGKKAQNLEVHLTVTVGLKPVIERFTDTLRRAYGTRHIGVTTSPYATYVLARDYLKCTEECVIIDVGEEVTDVAFVKDNLFLYQHSFPVGTYELYRALSNKSITTALEARSLVELYRMEKTAVRTSAAVEKALASFSKEWQGGFQKILDAGHYGFCLPERCFIVADQRFGQLFTETIATDPFVQHACSTGTVKPEFITDETMSTWVHFADNTVDVPLGAAILFATRIL